MENELMNRLDENVMNDIEIEEAQMTSGFRSQLTYLINSNSKENGSDTPDYILADYMAGCLTVFDKTLQAREQWYGRKVGSWKGKVEHKTA